jgi:hypothetical protein
MKHIISNSNVVFRQLKSQVRLIPNIILAGIVCITVTALIYSCKKDFLKYTPQGSLSEPVLANKEGVTKLLIGAYGVLDGQGNGLPITNSLNFGSTSPDNYIFGSSFGGESHGVDPVSITPSNGYLDDKWKADYEGVTRCNNVLKLVAMATDMTAAEKSNVIGQARFLRAHFYFDLKRMFNMVPWIDENTTDFNQPNTESIWPQIENDFIYATDSLPEAQSDPGRANKWAAMAYLAKTYLYQKEYTLAKPLFDQVISSGKTSGGVAYGLFDQYEDNLRPEKELSSPQAIFAVEMSANVGNGNISSANQGDLENYPIGAPFGCCGGFNPTLDLVNSFRTDPAGLPYLDDYNSHAVKSDLGVTSSEPFTPDNGNLDPRVDWTAGRRGIPFCDWGIVPGAVWSFNQSISGPYYDKKVIFWQVTAKQFYDAESWAPGSAINYLIIDFADVLLMAAECEAQLGNLDAAQAYVNRIRNRAANPAGWVYKYEADSLPLNGFSNTPAANYVIAPYPAGAFTTRGQAYALKAIYFERKLELAMEGHRFFDLVRWGIAAQVLNDFYNFENPVIPDVNLKPFVANKNEYYPIPQVEIDVSAVGGKATLTQNPGY